ncbi:hypothetical protein B0J13DRAFT_642067 [Dactylonectria estremocensis]|uniref:Uncharacterized protein n=1 Tax=Dactylonectria estremocensis TaxID=1079267 RepID=A0A9P9IQH2_9HYPO|nr:hypothetical protein B0J13DRAFT_642067 [Dactylonectria estremocensis]
MHLERTASPITGSPYAPQHRCPHCSPLSSLVTHYPTQHRTLFRISLARTSRREQGTNGSQHGLAGRALCSLDAAVGSLKKERECSRILRSGSCLARGTGYRTKHVNTAPTEMVRNGQKWNGPGAREYCTKHKAHHYEGRTSGIQPTVLAFFCLGHWWHYHACRAWTTQRREWRKKKHITSQHSTDATQLHVPQPPTPPSCDRDHSARPSLPSAIGHQPSVFSHQSSVLLPLFGAAHCTPTCICTCSAQAVFSSPLPPFQWCGPRSLSDTARQLARYLPVDAGCSALRPLRPLREAKSRDYFVVPVAKVTVHWVVTGYWWAS